MVISDAKFNELSDYLFENRIIKVEGEINSEMAEKVTSALLAMSMENNTNITMYINSPGGELPAVFAIYDLMQAIKPNVRTIAYGQAVSGASLLLAGGEIGKRYAYPNTEIMIHQPYSSFEGDFPRMIVEYDRRGLETKRLLDAYTDRCDKDFREIRDNTRVDCYLTPDEAKDYGLIDHIIC